MRRIAWTLTLLFLAVAARAQQIDTPTADHSHTYEGQALIFSRGETELVVALGTEGLVDHLFRFTHEDPFVLSTASNTSASTAYYSHDRLVLYAEKAAFVFSLAEKPEGRKSYTFTPGGEANFFEGSGLSHVYDLKVAIELSEAGVTDYLSAIEESAGNAPQPRTRPPPPTPGPGGGGCPSACSVVCPGGNMTLTCTSENYPCAFCWCDPNGQPRSACMTRP